MFGRTVYLGRVSDGRTRVSTYIIYVPSVGDVEGAGGTLLVSNYEYVQASGWLRAGHSAQQLISGRARQAEIIQLSL